MEKRFCANPMTLERAVCKVCKVLVKAATRSTHAEIGGAVMFFCTMTSCWHGGHGRMKQRCSACCDLYLPFTLKGLQQTLTRDFEGLPVLHVLLEKQKESNTARSSKACEDRGHSVLRSAASQLRRAT
eukprot:6456253-Amphidinium_carterae.1